MKPVKIYPKDICVVFEIYSQELERLSEFFEKLVPFAPKVVVGDNAEDVLRVTKEFSDMIKELLDSPILKGQ